MPDLSPEQQLFMQQQGQPSWWAGSLAKWTPTGQDQPYTRKSPGASTWKERKLWHDSAKIINPALLDMFGNQIPFHPAGMVHGHLVDIIMDNPDWDKNDITRYLNSDEAKGIRDAFDAWTKNPPTTLHQRSER